jgi:hypothetical protein
MKKLEKEEELKCKTSRRNSKTTKEKIKHKQQSRKHKRENRHILKLIF